jgi:CubicO group peptidase (beta-lactamase class C family)
MARDIAEGFTQDKFAAAKAAFEANFENGSDIGASFCATVNGETVVDLWGGYADPEKTRPWEKDTIVNVYSTTKTMTALTALLIADRGELDFDAPVAKYWPEFAAGGKAGVKVSHLMAHSAGLSGWREPITTKDLYDWEKMTSLLAAQAPLWEPGTQSGYHAITQGYLVGEVIRRIDGRSVGRFFADEVAGPLGADFAIGLPDAEHGRVANVVPPPPLDELIAAADPTSLPIRTLTNPMLSAEQSWEPAWRRAEIPAAGGHGNARSVARVQSVLSHGGEIDGVRLLSAGACEAPLEQQTDGTDLVLGVPLRFGLGYGLMSPQVPLSPNPRSYFWGGWGGSIVLNDLDARMTVAYVMNRMGEGTLGDTRGVSILFAAYGAIET